MIVLREKKNFAKAAFKSLIQINFIYIEFHVKALFQFWPKINLKKSIKYNTIEYKGKHLYNGVVKHFKNLNDHI